MFRKISPVASPDTPEPSAGSAGLHAALSPLDAIAERRIREAQARGEFDGLPGAGSPLQLDDDPLVPEDLRVAYRVLKNAGYLPPELETHREVRDIEQLMTAAGSDAERERLLARIRFLLTRGTSAAPRDPRVDEAWLEKIAERLEARRKT